MQSVSHFCVLQVDALLSCKLFQEIFPGLNRIMKDLNSTLNLILLTPRILVRSARKRQKGMETVHHSKLHFLKDFKKKKSLI